MVTSISTAILATAPVAAPAFEVTVGDTTLDLYGRARLNMIHDVDSDLGQRAEHRNIRLDNETGPEGHTQFQAFESRIGIVTKRKVEGAPFMTRIEGDFMGPNNNFRLRHAYGVWNGILAGQTYTNFTDIIGLTPTLDGIGTLGRTSLSRQAQLRYTTGGLSVAVENNRIGGPDLNGLDGEDELKNDLPDFTARYSTKSGDLKYFVSGVVRQIQYYDSSSDRDESAFGYGLGLGAEYNITPDVKVGGVLTHGDGVGRYIFVAATPLNSAYVDSENDLETISATGLTLGGTISVGPGDLNLAYALVDIDLDDAFDAGAVAPDANEKLSSVYLNYIISPFKNFSYGAEVAYHQRETIAAGEGDAIRLQGQVTFTF